MPNFKKIIVSVPEDVLKQADCVAKEEDITRSELIRQGIALYLGEHKKRILREKMKRGYTEMGMINLTLSEEGMEYAVSDLVAYEKKLLESE